jgi:hypothetical protein
MTLDTDSFEGSTPPSDGSRDTFPSQDYGPLLPEWRGHWRLTFANVGATAPADASTSRN